MAMPILLATDLDRTVIPNGAQRDSPEALPRFRALADRKEVMLVYVSGRGKALLKEAIDTYELPLPSYAIGDVGTTIFVTHDQSWDPLSEWQAKIAPDWKGKSREDLAAMLLGVEGLTLQEPDKQNTFKLSYYASEYASRNVLLRAVHERLASEDIRASVIWSVDEQAHTGLLDVLPKSATKLHALRFLREHLGMPEPSVVFCGDSGNDMPALTSGLNAVIVANARAAVKDEALAAVRQKGCTDKLYIADGNFLGMNGNYSAGVLEGVAHFFPEMREPMAER